MTEYSTAFIIWYELLVKIADEKELQWLVSSCPSEHLASYAKGISSEDEFAEIEELAQWRGCGCGGGG